MGEQLALAIRTDIHLDTRLMFVASHDGFSQYLDDDGDMVYLAHGTAARLMSFDELMSDLSTYWGRAGNWEALLDMTHEPERVEDEVTMCEDCGEPARRDETLWTGDETTVCESCFGEYYYCVECEEAYRNTTTTLNDREVCERCRNNQYAYCDVCDGYVRQDDDDHYHSDDGCDCEAPRQSFAVRNDGMDPLPNDTRVTVSLPAGTISGEGLAQIAWRIRRDAPYDDPYTDLSCDLAILGDRWQTKDGNYTKRLSRHAYKAHGLKLSPEIVSAVGNIAREHSSTAPEFHLEVTRDLNLPAEDFANDESCWWNSYASSRCALKSNGGFGLRAFNGWGCSGRAWVMPLRDNPPTFEPSVTGLVPTFETMAPDAFVVFNGYGNLEGYAAARIVSHMAGMTYRKISFRCDPMYVNGSSAYLVAPERIAERYTDGSLALYVETHSNLYADESAGSELTHV